MVKQFFILSAKRFVVSLLISVPFLADISAQDYQPTRQNAYPSRYRQSSTQNQRTQNAYPLRYRQSSSQNQRTQDTFFSRFRQSSSQYQRNGSTRREYSNPFMKQDKNENSSKTEKSSKRSANSGEESRQLSPSVSDNTSGDVELVVTGDGPTKEKATLSALRSALEQVYGTMVSSNTKILNDELVKDEIVSISTGIVKKYTYLSEKEVGGRFYVVVKALVTPQKLITYAKQKGASTELAGATFAANVRIQKLNEENKRIASRNITEMQLKLLANCFDCEIKDMEEPTKRYTSAYENNYGFGADVYRVNFKICLRFNQNAAIIQDLEKQKKELGPYAFPYESDAETILHLLFDRIVVYDDMGSYNLKLVLGKRHIGSSIFTDYNIGRESSIKRPSLMGHGNGGFYEGTFDIPYEDAFRGYSLYKYKLVGSNYKDYNTSTERKVYWNVVVPNFTFVEINASMVYDLDDLDKITGIHVALKDLSEESTSHNPSKNVSLATRTESYLNVFNWDYIYSNYNDEQFEAFLKEEEKSLKKSPHNSDDDVKYILNALREKYWKGK